MLDTIDTQTRQFEALRADVVEGLSLKAKRIPSRWLYDDRGSELFEEITRVEAYYPTRTETGILRHAAAEIARFLGRNCLLLEYGAGSGLKTEILLDALEAPRLYVPIDIAVDFLSITVARMGRRFPDLETRPLTTDFTRAFELPHELPDGRRCAFFPGSTIGNLDLDETNELLRQMQRHVGPDGVALIGVDLIKSRETLLAAYDDVEGVTAAFNLNLLHRLNRELNADFKLGLFYHEARWNEAASAIEMHLVSRVKQQVRVGGRSFKFEVGESIHTESSRKYDPAGFAKLVAQSGWEVMQIWADPARRFAVCGLKPVTGRRLS